MKKFDKKLLISLILLFITIIVAIYFIVKGSKSEDYVVSDFVQSTDVPSLTEEKEQIAIHVDGEVISPGVIYLNSGSRISDAINLCGGATSSADFSKINLAYVLEDGQKVHVPSIYEPDDIETVSNDAGENVIIESRNSNSNMVNINTATQSELEALPGVGASTALKIINYRSQNGKFKKIEDLMNVSGIGEAKFSTIKEHITIKWIIFTKLLCSIILPLLEILLISQSKGGFYLINKVEIASVNTAKLPVLTNKEKNELLIKIKNGDTEAREEFINGNLRLVLSIIQRFNGRGEDIDDLFQVGCVGLIKAIDNFDMNLNVQFSTYAVPMIIGEIRRHLRDNNPIRVSRSMRDLAYKALQTKERLFKQNQKEPTVEDIAKELGVDKEDVVVSLDSIQDPISLQEPVYNEGSESIYVMDQVKDSKNTDEFWAETLTITEAMKKLSNREKSIISRRFFDGRTQMEVANEIGISQAQVSRLEKNAIERIKKMYK